MIFRMNKCLFRCCQTTGSVNYTLRKMFSLSQSFVDILHIFLSLLLPSFVIQIIKLSRLSNTRFKNRLERTIECLMLPTASSSQS